MRKYDKEKAAEYYLNNKEQITKRNAVWQRNNREKARGYVAKYKTTEKYAEHWRRSYWDLKLRAAKKRAEQLGVPFDLSLEDIPIETHCKYLEIPLRITVNEGQVMDSPSLDRIDPSKGYVKGNVQTISKLANLMKSSANMEQLITFAQNVLKQHVK